MNTLTWEELSSSAACEEVERVSSDWPRDPLLALAFSNRPLPLLCGGDESESFATPPSSSGNKPTVIFNTSVYKKFYQEILPVSGCIFQTPSLVALIVM